MKKGAGRYTYTQNHRTGGLRKKIVQENRRRNAHFGTSVLIKGNTLFIGTLRDERDRNSSGSNAVYVYTQRESVWWLVQKLKPHMDDNDGRFGAAIAYSESGNTLAVGAPKSNTVKDNSGAVYIFTQTKKNAAMWSLKEIITHDKVRRGDKFGSSIAFEGLNLFVGARGKDTHKRNVGAVYLYNASIVPCDEKMAEKSEENTKISQPQNVLKSLKEKKEVVDRLITGVTSLAELLGSGIQNAYNDITKKRGKYRDL